MLGELEGSTSEDEEEESFGSMKRRIFAKKVTMTGPERYYQRFKALCSCGEF